MSSLPTGLVVPRTQIKPGTVFRYQRETEDYYYAPLNEVAPARKSGVINRARGEDLPDWCTWPSRLTTSSNAWDLLCVVHPKYVHLYGPKTPLRVKEATTALISWLEETP